MREHPWERKTDLHQWTEWKQFTEGTVGAGRGLLSWLPKVFLLAAAGLLGLFGDRKCRCCEAILAS